MDLVNENGHTGYMKLSPFRITGDNYTLNIGNYIRGDIGKHTDFSMIFINGLQKNKYIIFPHHRSHRISIIQRPLIEIISCEYNWKTNDNQNNEIVILRSS